MNYAVTFGSDSNGNTSFTLSYGSVGVDECSGTWTQSGNSWTASGCSGGSNTQNVYTVVSDGDNVYGSVVTQTANDYNVTTLNSGAILAMVGAMGILCNYQTGYNTGLQILLMSASLFI